MTVEEIIDAIDKLFADTSVSKQHTLNRMQEIRDHAGMNIDAIEEDIAANDSGEEG